MARHEPPAGGRSATRPRRRKTLGQHHLRDPRRARPLVEHLGVDGATVVEVGPGGGALTGALVEAGAARVVAVELDPAWAFRLRGGERVLAVVADALELAWERIPAAWRVAGNLPYNVGTAILERLVTSGPAGLRAGFLLQKEVVDRLVAAPGTSAYGALSVLVAARAAVRRLGDLPPSAFRPPPQVESSFVGLELRPPAFGAGGPAAFEAVVRAAFGQRRKTLRNALGAVWGRERAEAALARAGIAPELRAERLGVDEFAALGAALAGSG